MRAALEALCDTLRGLGAFAGRNRDEAFTVSCDAGTMTQADIDNGRVIATLSFLPAQPIERVTVVLQLIEAASEAAREAA
jgi:phage tail sheath protein FI